MDGPAQRLLCRCAVATGLQSHHHRRLRARFSPGRRPAGFRGAGAGGGIPYFLVGHVGDGSFHMGYPIDPTARPSARPPERLNHQLVQRALQLGGTCTGEHGVGLHKMEFLVTETGQGAVDMMRTIKRALDPHNILNPGKIFCYNKHSIIFLFWGATPQFF